MAYLGKTPSQAVRSRYFYTAAGGETSLSGSDDKNDTLIFADGNYVDVYLNGVLLVAGSDYNVNTVNTISGLTALVASDVVEIVVYDTFAVFGGTFQGTLTANSFAGDLLGAVDFLAKNKTGSTIPVGSPVYIVGNTGNDIEIAIADADDPAKMPAFGITSASIANNAEGSIITYGRINDFDTSAFALGDELYVSTTGTLTATRPTGSTSLVQKVAKVVRNQQNNGILFVTGAGRTNDTPNAITANSINLGSTTTVSGVLDEDTMTSDSATSLATQQSIKAYVDSQIGANNELSEVLSNGNTTGGTDISFGDNDKAIFGAGSDLQIYHDGGSSWVSDVGAGNLKLSSDGAGVFLQKGATEFLGEFLTDGAVRLYYDNAAKFETTSTGIDVTGTVTSDGVESTCAAGDANQALLAYHPTSTSARTIAKFQSNVGGTQQNKVVILCDGSVGIGTSSPAAKLQVKDGTNINVRVGALGSVASVHSINDAGSAYQDFRIDGSNLLLNTYSGGNVGIGDSAPSQKLNVSGNVMLEGSDQFVYLTNVGTGNSGIYVRGITANSTLRSHTTGIFTWEVTGSEKMRIDSNGFVGIGTSSPSSMISVVNNQAAHTSIDIFNSSGSSSARGQLRVGYDAANCLEIFRAGNSADITLNATQNGSIIFQGAGTEKMRIDSSGNVLVGKTAVSNTAKGSALSQTGEINSTITTAGGASQNIFLNRQDAYGTCILMRYANASVGHIGLFTGNLMYLGAGNTGLKLGADIISPSRADNGNDRDNVIDLGKSASRFDNIYATNGTIQTSDQNEKQQIAALTDAEITAAKAISALFKTFKWNSAVEAKGDAARTHAGVIAQDVEAAMISAGLDAGDYAFFISDTFTNDDGNNQTRKGIRYPELLAFVGAATEQRLSNIETRITALENV